MFSKVLESRKKSMSKCVCFNCRKNYNSVEGYFCSNGKFIPRVANTDTTVETVAEDLRVKKGFDFGRRGRINDPTLGRAEFFNENPALSNENAFSNQVNYGDEQSTSSQDHARNVEINLLMALNSKQYQIQERTTVELNNPALFCRSRLNTLAYPGPSTQLNERSSPVNINKKRFICHVCDRGFKRKGDLKEHVFMHDGIKPYACGICQKSFTQKSTLRSHMNTHTGDRPFSCTFCEKLFTRKDILNAHLRIHNNEKPFVCQTCGKVFRYKSNLQVHANTHTDDKPFHCEVCGKRYKSKNSLNSHMKNHEQK